MKKLALIVSFVAFPGLAAAATEIHTCDDLQAMNSDLGGDYVLGSNVDCFGFPFTSIGPAFTGELNGAGFKIQGLICDSSSACKQGLFTAIEGTGYVHDLELEDFFMGADAATLSSVGSLAGRVTGVAGAPTMVENVHVTGTSLVQSSILSGLNNVGGLVGRLQDAAIVDSSSQSNVTGNRQIGGLVGRLLDAKVQGCSASGDVTSVTASSHSGNNIGGLFGRADSSDILQSFATGDVTTLGSNAIHAGGLGGRLSAGATVTDCFAWGDVTSYSEIVGGLVGFGIGTITRSYAAGSVSGPAGSTGCLIGDETENNPPNTGSTVDSYYDATVCNDPAYQNGIGTAKTTAEMQTQSTFAGWDFATTWSLKSGEYPNLTVIPEWAASYYGPATVGFEDMLVGSDEDYNDVVVRAHRKCVFGGGYLRREELSFTGLTAGAGFVNQLFLQVPASGTMTVRDLTPDNPDATYTVAVTAGQEVELLDRFKRAFEGDPEEYHLVNTRGDRIFNGRNRFIDFEYDEGTPFAGGCPRPEFIVKRESEGVRITIDTPSQTTSTYPLGVAPMSVTSTGVWYPPIEFVNIAAAYPGFVPWTNGDTAYANWPQFPVAGEVLPLTTNIDATFPLALASSCSDGIENSDETGVDCGGKICKPCVDSPTPPLPTCDDNLQNGDETGVDCGGSCAPCSPPPPAGCPCSAEEYWADALGDIDQCIAIDQDCSDGFCDVLAIVPPDASLMVRQSPGIGLVCGPLFGPAAPIVLTPDMAQACVDELLAACDGADTCAPTDCTTDGTCITDDFAAIDGGSPGAVVESFAEPQTFTTLPTTGLPVCYTLPGVDGGGNAGCGETAFGNRVDWLNPAIPFPFISGQAGLLTFYACDIDESQLATEITTVPGGEYTVSFDLRRAEFGAPTTPRHQFEASAVDTDTSAVIATSGVQDNPAVPVEVLPVTFDFTAVGTSTTLLFTGTFLGNNANQDLGFDNLTVTKNAAAPAPHPPSRYYAGYQSTCRLEADDTATCWGRNSHGQTNAPATPFVKLGMGLLTNCGIDFTGSIDCWGRNAWGESNIENLTGTYIDLDGGADHSCALRDDGVAFCTGRNVEGQTNVPAGETFTDIETGSYYSCGLRADGTAVCWGSPGHGATTPPAGPFKDIDANSDSACGLLTTDEAVCWGFMNGIPSIPAGPYLQVGAGHGYGCGLHSDGSIRCWTGNGANNVVDNVPAGNDFDALSVGVFHACAERTDNTAVCWGTNHQGATDIP